MHTFGAGPKTVMRWVLTCAIAMVTGLSAVAIQMCVHRLQWLRFVAIGDQLLLPDW